jgi:hypothetical protein
MGGARSVMHSVVYQELIRTPGLQLRDPNEQRHMVIFRKNMVNEDTTVHNPGASVPTQYLRNRRRHQGKL